MAEPLLVDRIVADLVIRWLGLMYFGYGLGLSMVEG